MNSHLRVAIYSTLLQLGGSIRKSVTLLLGDGGSPGCRSGAHARIFFFVSHERRRYRRAGLRLVHAHAKKGMMAWDPEL